MIYQLTLFYEKIMIFLQPWTQDNFILPAMPIRGMPMSKDRVERMKLVHNLTITVILPSRNNILADMMFKISVGYMNLD